MKQRWHKCPQINRAVLGLRARSRGESVVRVNRVHNRVIYDRTVIFCDCSMPFQGHQVVSLRERRQICLVTHSK